MRSTAIARPKPKPLSKAYAKSSTKSSDGYHHGDLRAALLETAIKLLKTKSPNELSLRELARTIGVSQAAPYRHFKDKEELLAALMKEGFELKHKYMLESLQKHKGNTLDMFYNCGISYFRMGLNHPQHFKLMFSCDVVPNEKYPDLQKAACSTFVLLRNMIIKCQKEKILGPGDPYHKSLHCWSLVHGFTSLYTESRLEWLGVTKENAETALKSILSQHLVGINKATKDLAFGFELFQSKESKFYLEMMNAISHEIP